jgi:hypothetical protein
MTEGPEVAEDLARLTARLLGGFTPEPGTVEGAGGGPIVCIPQDQLQEILGRAWMMGARVVMNTAQNRRTCRICGCWELEACEGGCAWAEPNLCTTCTTSAADTEDCIACGEQFQDGDRYHLDASGGCIHADCCGPEPEGYVDLETGEPIGAGAPFPEPRIWGEERKAGAEA